MADLTWTQQDELAFLSGMGRHGIPHGRMRDRETCLRGYRDALRARKVWWSDANPQQLRDAVEREIERLGVG